MTKPYQLELRVRNNFLLTKMRERGFEKGVDLAKKANVAPNDISSMLNLKKPAMGVKGEWHAAVLRVSNILQCLPEDLFPPQHIQTPLAQNRASLVIDMTDIRSLTHSVRSLALPALKQMEQADIKEMVMKTLDILSLRERTIVEGHLFDGKTYKELGEQVIPSVSVERARQIEMRAYEKMRHKMREENKVSYQDGREMVADFID